MEDFFDQDKPLDQVTLQELDLLGAAIFEQKKACEKVEEELTKKKELLTKLQAKMLSILERFGRSNYTIPGMGMLVKTQRMSVALPQTPEDREAFFDYLEDRGVFEDLITVNSMTLNAFYKKEFDIAAEEGRAVGFKIPGIGEPKIVATLNMRKGK